MSLEWQHFWLYRFAFNSQLKFDIFYIQCLASRIRFLPAFLFTFRFRHTHSLSVNPIFFFLVDENLFVILAKQRWPTSSSKFMLCKYAYYRVSSMRWLCAGIERLRGFIFWQKFQFHKKFNAKTVSVSDCVCVRFSIFFSQSLIGSISSYEIACKIHVNARDAHTHTHKTHWNNHIFFLLHFYIPFFWPNCLASTTNEANTQPKESTNTEFWRVHWHCHMNNLSTQYLLSFGYCCHVSIHTNTIDSVPYRQIIAIQRRQELSFFFHFIFFFAFLLSVESVSRSRKLHVSAFSNSIVNVGN